MILYLTALISCIPSKGLKPSSVEPSWRKEDSFPVSILPLTVGFPPLFSFHKQFLCKLWTLRTSIWPFLELHRAFLFLMLPFLSGNTEAATQARVRSHGWAGLVLLRARGGLHCEPPLDLRSTALLRSQTVGIPSSFRCSPAGLSSTSWEGSWRRFI